MTVNGKVVFSSCHAETQVAASLTFAHRIHFPYFNQRHGHPFHVPFFALMLWREQGISNGLLCVFNFLFRSEVGSHVFEVFLVHAFAIVRLTGGLRKQLGLFGVHQREKVRALCAHFFEEDNSVFKLGWGLILYSSVGRHFASIEPRFLRRIPRVVLCTSLTFMTRHRPKLSCCKGSSGQGNLSAGCSYK